MTLRLPPAVTLVALAATLGIIGTLGLREIDNPDLFFHVALGKCLLAGQWPPALDALYFTPTTTGWLADLRNSLAGDFVLAFVASGGFVAVQFLCLGLLFAGGWVIWRHHHVATKAAPDPVLVCCVTALYTLGTLPLQTPRNAAFSLLLVPLTLVLTGRALRLGGWSAFFPAAVFAMWTTLHGSYLLGLVLVLAMATGSVLDQTPRIPQIRRASALVALCFAVCLPANPALLHYFALPLDHFSQVLPAAKSPPRPTAPAIPLPTASLVSLQASESNEDGTAECPIPIAESARSTLRPPSPPGPWTRLGHVLIAPVWGTSGAGPLSGDFLPSWRTWRYLPVSASLLLGVGTLLTVLAAGRSRRFTRLLPLLATLYFAICYERGAGYLTIVSVWCLAGLPIAALLRAQSRALALGLAVTAVALGFAASRGTLGVVLGENTHTFGLGASPLRDAPLCRWVLHQAPGCRPFTTVLTGSFALSSWQPEKPVFIDAFFPAHRDAVWQAYLTAQRERSTDPLVETFTLDAALVENCRNDWQAIWRDNADFSPAALGLGMTFYRLNAEPPRPTEPEILFTASDLARVKNVVTRHNAAAQVLNLAHQLDLLADPSDISRFREKYPALLAAAPAFLCPGPGGPPARDADGYWILYR